MKSFRFILLFTFLCVFGLIACSDESETPTDPAEGPPDDVNSGNVCSRDLCSANEALKQECEEFMSNCLQVEDEDECVGGAWLICRGT
jgi:hypothetical protein